MIATLRPYASLAGRGAMWLLFYFALVGFALNGAAASLTGEVNNWLAALFAGQAATMALLFARRS